MEECSEIIKICAKIVLFGYDEINMYKPDGPTNRIRLEEELGDMLFWAYTMVDRGDISEDNIDAHVDSEEKYNKSMRFTKYQPNSTWK